jgi:hypothetical protein
MKAAMAFDDPTMADDLRTALASHEIVFGGGGKLLAVSIQAGANFAEFSASCPCNPVLGRNLAS